MKCWKSAFNAQGSKLIQFNSIHHKNWGPPPLNANVFYFFESHPIYDQTQGSSVVFLTLEIILLYIFNDQTFLQNHMN
jgi:hypothetical protein